MTWDPILQEINDATAPQKMSKLDALCALEELIHTLEIRCDTLRAETLEDE